CGRTVPGSQLRRSVCDSLVGPCHVFHLVSGRLAEMEDLLTDDLRPADQRETNGERVQELTAHPPACGDPGGLPVARFFSKRQLGILRSFVFLHDEMGRNLALRFPSPLPFEPALL